MEKSFVGLGAKSAALPVRMDEQEALARRGRIGSVLRQMFGLAVGCAVGWAVLYGCGVGLGVGLVRRAQGVRTVCLICAVGGAVVARWLWPRRYLPAALAGCGLLVGSALCFRGYLDADTLLFAGADALLAAGSGLALRLAPAVMPCVGRLLA